MIARNEWRRGADEHIRIQQQRFAENVRPPGTGVIASMLPGTWKPNGI